MIDVAILSIIRRWHFRDHVSLREIAKRLGVSRNTVRRYIRAGTVLPAYPERYAARLVTSGDPPFPYLLLADSLAGIRDMLPPGLDRSERHAGDPPEIVEMWLTG